MASTISAIATASGISSISIVRVSGDNALLIAKKITKKDRIEPRVAHLFSLYNQQNQLIDQAIVIYFKSPKSFTGEDIVEFQCHGGLIVAQEILDTTIAYGARLAQAGEFSKRAFLNGKIDLTKAEAIAKLIEAKSLDGAKILARQLKGELKEFIDQARDSILRAIAYSEVMIDYAQEDIPSDISENLLSQLDNLIETIDKVVESSHRRKGLIDGFKVAIIGKPNVGKSSLLNKLLSYDRAIVSDIAGTTRDTIEEQIRVGSHIVRLIDTAGIRDSNDKIEQIGVSRSMDSIKDADVIVALFDISNSFDREDSKIMDILKNSNKDIIILLNKSDLPHKIDKSIFRDFNTIELSAKNDVRKLTQALELLFNKIGADEEIMLVSTRQIEAVNRAKRAIMDSKNPLIDGELEFFSYHLQDAVKELSSISKPYDSEEILDKMFGEFCLGK
jgi:tRNA modification GTPase